MAPTEETTRASKAPAYRDDVGHLREQLDSARRELTELQERLREAQGHQARSDELRAEIESIERDLRGRERKRSLPMLDQIKIASPCEASWDEMVGDQRKRFCAHCNKNVFNLSAMSRPEAEALIVEAEGKLCVRYYQRADGTLLTQDCPVGLRKRRRRWAAVTALAASMIGVSTLFFARTTTGEPATVLGDIAPAPCYRSDGTVGQSPEPLATPLPVEVKGEVEAPRSPPAASASGAARTLAPGHPARR